MELQDIDLKELIENETGEKFNKQGYLKCPFHNEKTPSLRVKFFSDKNKEQFHCFGCSEHGDVLDFVAKFRGLDYLKSKEYLGLEVEKTENELLEEKVQKYIDWELNNFRRGQELLGIFKFTNKSNKIAYFKAKFKLPDGKKQLSYYHIENDKTVAKRGTDEIPYNLYKTLEAIKNDDVIIIVEGEKDANTINSLFKNKEFVATSIKGCKNIEILQEKGVKVYVIGDTGQAGKQYKWQVWNFFKNYAKEFKFINLPGIKEMGDNKDVTDWIECGHNQKDLLKAFDRSLDIKNKYELQQDKNGVYKTVFKEKSDEIIKSRRNLTDFKILEATRINFIDEEAEGVKLILKSPTGETIERIGPSTVFDDTKTFKNFLGTLDAGFKGKVDDLTDLKGWINKYFAIDVETVHQGSKFIYENEKMLFVTENGAISSDGSTDKTIKAKEACVNIENIDDVDEKELRDIKNNIFKFSSPEKSISIIGTIINNLAVSHCERLKHKLHILLIVGEAGSGKSTILENVIAPILNYPLNEKKSIGLARNFTLTQDFSNGNYTTLYEEFKPSNLNSYTMSVISEFLRNLYDRTTILKGRKNLTVRKYTLSRPIVIVGEESYPNAEKALMERSCVVYFSRNDQTPKSSEAIKWIRNNEVLLNKLGKSLIKTVLNITTEEYQKMRDEAEEKLKELKNVQLSNRPLTTAINICCGIQIFNKLLAQHKIRCLKDYEKYIASNIKNEVLEGGEEVNSIVEQMLILYNDMIENGRAFNSDEVIKNNRGDGIFIKTSEMINQIQEHCSRVGADIIPLKLRDFKKQAQKAGYLKGVANKVVKLGLKSVRFDTYNMEKLRKLKVNSIAPPEFEELSAEESKVIPFK